MKTKKSRILLYSLIPALGVLFLLWYVKHAACDVVYSDYVRLVNSYLPDVWNPKKFLVADVLTRLPINYLERIINVGLFSYSITFERVLGVLSLGLAALLFSWYSIKQDIGPVWFLLLMAVMFSLNKWEMITNGSGWSHFFAFACFYYHELVLDRVWGGREKKGDFLRLVLLPWLIILGTAGPYCASYAAVMMLSCIFAFFAGGRKDRRYLLWLLGTLAPLLLYMVSNSFAVEEHAGATGRSLGVILAENPTFPVRFLLKSFAGMVVGGEELKQWIQDGIVTNRQCYLMGAGVLTAYFGALISCFRFRIYEKTLFPLMLLAGGGGNHLLIFLSRYIFEQEDYALSSRYALQFQVGILGIILAAAFVWGQGRKKVNRVWIALFCLAILLGNGYTTYREIKKAPYREERYEEMARTALTVPDMSDEELAARGKELENLYEYRKGPEKIRDAFRILKENRLNVFR